MHGFAVLCRSIPWPTQKRMSSSLMCTEANIISWRQHDVSLCPGSGVFKTFASNMHFCASTWKKKNLRHFLQSFRPRKCFYAIIAIKHAFLIHKLGPSGFNTSLSGSGFNISLMAQQMLMHRKWCLIPILNWTNDSHIEHYQEAPWKSKEFSTDVRKSWKKHIPKQVIRQSSLKIPLSFKHSPHRLTMYCITIKILKIWTSEKLL